MSCFAMGCSRSWPTNSMLVPSEGWPWMKELGSQMIVMANTLVTCTKWPEHAKTMVRSHYGGIHNMRVQRKNPLPLLQGAELWSTFWVHDFCGGFLQAFSGHSLGLLARKSINHHKSKKQDGGLKQGPPHGWSAPQATKLSALESFDLYVRTHRFRPSWDPTHYLDIQNPNLGLKHMHVIPHICQRHHWWCQCQNFHPGVKKSWINVQNVCFTCVSLNHSIMIYQTVGIFR